MPEHISRYFLATARAAAHTPRLRRLRVEFHGLTGCGLQYEVHEGDRPGSAEVYVWGSTGLNNIWVEVRDAWEAACAARGNRVEIVSGLEDEEVSRFQFNCQACRDDQIWGWAPLKPVLGLASVYVRH